MAWVANPAISRTADDESCAAAQCDAGVHRSGSAQKRARGLALSVLRNLEFVGLASSLAL